MEALAATVPAELDGSRGINRAPGGAKVLEFVDTDYDAIMEWLTNFEDSPHTHRAYRREAERLYVWCLCILGKPISSLNRNDLARYEAFLEDPRPSEAWCGKKESRTSEHWRPFEKPLKPDSRRHAMNVCNALLSYLADGNYIEANPMVMIRRRKRRMRGRSQQKNKLERYLEPALWNHVLAFVEKMPTKTKGQRNRCERYRYLLALLYELAPRVHEVAAGNMGDIRQVRGKWWWKVSGKGREEDDYDYVPVTNNTLSALARYRAYIGLKPSLPLPDDDAPLFPAIDGKTRVTANAVYRTVKKIMTQAAKGLPKADAEKLRAASTHWLRHTRLTHLADAGIKLRYIQAMARHAKINTTTEYLHENMDNLHEVVESSKLSETVANQTQEGGLLDP